MAKKPLGYDVWLTASNRVYRDVPYDVLTDWLQQGRVVGDDRIRPETGAEWVLVVALPAFAAFLPIAAPSEAEDAATALEPVELDVPLRRRPTDEDDDVDMIPLIDISLVLLIFFMMTATVAVSGADIATPTALYGAGLTTDQEMIWVGVTVGKADVPAYSIGQGSRPAEAGDSDLTLAQMLEKLDARLKSAGRGCTVRVAGHKKLRWEAMLLLNSELEKRRGPNRIKEIKAEVNEKSS